MSKLPGDVYELLPWFSLIRRIISVSHSGGYGVVSARIIVNARGEPVFWSEPQLTRLEPKGNPEAVEQLIATLAKPEAGL